MTATTMVLFPREKFAQLSSSINVLGYGSIIVGNLLAGAFMDLFDSNYRTIFVWSLTWFAAALGLGLVDDRRDHQGGAKYGCG